MSAIKLNQTDSNTSNSLREELFKYVKYWKWILFSVIVSLVFAKLYLRYSIPQYKAVTTLLIKGEGLGSVPSELEAFSDLGLMGSNKSSIEDEIEILKSRSLIQKAIIKGNFYVSYSLEGRIKSTEEYEKNPIAINFKNQDSSFFEKDTLLKINVISSNKFELFDQQNNLNGIFFFGQIIKSNILGEYTVNKTYKNRDFKNGSVIINLMSVKNLTNFYRSKLMIAPLSKYSNVLELIYTDPISKKAEDFLNVLVTIYNKDAIQDKKIISQNTANFINERLGIITDELYGVEKDAENYKNYNKITDLPTEAEIYLDNASESNKNKMAIGTQLKVVEIMLDFIKKSDNIKTIPANIVPDDNKSSALISEYNLLILEKNRILNSSTPENPIVIRVNDKIDLLKNAINEGLINLKSSLKIKVLDENYRGVKILNKISKIPKQEREFRNIIRQQQIKEELYLYLFKKREETAIAQSATEPISKIIDIAYSSNSPISPNRQLIYLIALILGTIFPLAIIYVKYLLDTKVKDRHDIESNLTIPFIGDVPHSDDHNEIIQSSSRTSSAEAIRIVRTNLEFLLNNVDSNKAKTIFLTSTLPKEGKTFIAINLAATIAISGKKVLLIGMDIRNPKLDEYVNLPSRGLTNYLSSSDSDIKNYIVNQKNYEHFDILPAGIIPPNPAELLMSKKVESMFNELKSIYDYIVVDTAPVSLVTDTLLISKNADAFIYVVRANYLEKAYLKTPETLYKENKLPSMSVLLNDTDTQNGYGYGYGQEIAKAKPWYKKIFSFSYLGF